MPLVRREAERSAPDAPTLSERIRAQVRSERRFGYWQVAAVLAAVGALALFFPGRGRRPAGVWLKQPGSSMPEYRTLEYEDISLRDVERMNVVVRVSQGMGEDSLRAALEWALFTALDEHNRRQKAHYQVVWAYALDDATASKGRWRAMAVWVDPRLSPALAPATARLGGDAQRQGDIEYDFTNPGRSGGSTPAGH
jgi:hypothetical protein